MTVQLNVEHDPSAFSGAWVQLQYVGVVHPRLLTKPLQRQQIGRCPVQRLLCPAPERSCRGVTFLFFYNPKLYRFPPLADLSIRRGFDTHLRDYDSTQGEASLHLQEEEGDDGAAGSLKHSTEDELLGTAKAATAKAAPHVTSPISFDLFLQHLCPLTPRLTHVCLPKLSEVLSPAQCP